MTSSSFNVRTQGRIIPDVRTKIPPERPSTWRRTISEEKSPRKLSPNLVVIGDLGRTAAAAEIAESSVKATESNFLSLVYLCPKSVSTERI